MDHLPVPTNPAFPKPVVRFLGQRYDGQSFVDYPKRRKISRAFFLHPASLEKARVLAPFLQAWLFLGLFEEIFKLPSGQLIKEDQTEGGKQIEIINTSILHDARTERLEDVLLLRKENSSEFANLVKDYKSCINETDFILTSAHRSIIDQLGNEVYTSIHLMLQFVAYTVRYAENFNLIGIPSLKTGANDRFFIERMRAKGWCPTLINLVTLKGDVEAMYYISNLDLVIIGDHQDCTEFKCSSNQISSDRYKLQHAAKRCAIPKLCLFWYAPQKVLTSILESGSIPLIVNDEVNRSKLRMRLVRSKVETRYVAISHVWSHGKGNPKSNSLPLCQLSYISKKVNALYPDENAPVPFWIDTLCCPTKPPHAQALALEQMGSTYENADKVLVLDSTLETVLLPGAGRDRETAREALLRIFASPWMRRLWTLQEALLAKQLHFQFADGALEFNCAHAEAFFPFSDIWSKKEEILQGRFPSRNASVAIRLFTEIHDFLLFVSENLRPLRYKKKLLFENIAHALQYRSTSMAIDEALCIGTILKMDISRILSVSSSQRMVQVWTLLGERGELKQSAVFDKGRKLNVTGFRWAPATFLQHSCYTSEHAPTAKLTGSGLLFDSPAFVLQYRVGDALDRFAFKSSSNKNYICWRQCNNVYNNKNSNLEKYISRREVSSNSTTSFAILMDTGLDDVPELELSQSPHMKPDARISRCDENIIQVSDKIEGALVSIELVLEGVSYVRLHSHVLVSTLEEVSLTHERADLNFDEWIKSYPAEDPGITKMEGKSYDRP